MHRGTHAWVCTGDGELEVHLGSGLVHREPGARLKDGDDVELNGARVTIDGNPAMIAISLVPGPDVLKLRDDDGRPLRSAWHRRQAP